jgi:hypothetical protein
VRVPTSVSVSLFICNLFSDDLFCLVLCIMMNLIILQKSYDFYLYLNQVTRSFPKSEKFVLTVQLKSLFLDMIQLIIRANKSGDKKRHLFDFDVKLEQFKLLLRLAKDLQYLKLNQYEFASSKIVEIGKLLGGWMKSCR